MGAREDRFKPDSNNEVITPARGGEVSSRYFMDFHRESPTPISPSDLDSKEIEALLERQNSLFLSLSLFISLFSLPCASLSISSPSILRASIKRNATIRWQSHDNQCRVVIGNPISLPNCTPNRLRARHRMLNFLHVPRGPRSHVLYSFLFRASVY